jgi:hypothetical protein
MPVAAADSDPNDLEKLGRLAEPRDRLQLVKAGGASVLTSRLVVSPKAVLFHREDR